VGRGGRRGTRLLDVIASSRQFKMPTIRDSVAKDPNRLKRPKISETLASDCQSFAHFAFARADHDHQADVDQCSADGDLWFARASETGCVMGKRQRRGVSKTRGPIDASSAASAGVGRSTDQPAARQGPRGTKGQRKGGGESAPDDRTPGERLRRNLPAKSNRSDRI